MAILRGFELLFSRCSVIRFHTVSWETAPSYRLHQVSYCSNQIRLHQIAYNLGDLPSRLHSISWATEARRLHSITYASVSTVLSQDQRFHTISYSVVGTDPLTSASRYHTILYDGSGISPLFSDQRLHTISYEVVGTDLLTVASHYHEILYEGSGISPFVVDQRLHEISYAVVGADPVTSSTRYHEILYSVVGTDPLTAATRYHEVFYEGSGISPLVADQRLHILYYTVVLPEPVQRLHEISYAVDTTVPVSSASAFHQVSYGVFASQYALHEIFYKSIVLDQRLHIAGWKTDTEQRRLHEVVYRSININPIIEAGLITVGDGGLNTYDFLGITITADEESPYWQCEMVLKDSADYVRFSRDTAYIVRMFGVDFHFIVDSRSLQRSIDDQGSYQETCTITGLSPLALKARPRATRLTNTWETPILASAVVTELLGANTWALVDWLIPAYRLACERADPLAVAKQVVEAVGGLIESQPDGSLVCRHRWPTSIAAMDSAVADQTLDERTIYSASEAPTQDELVDRIRIYDTEPGFQDRLEYVPNTIGENDDPRNGILYAFPSPWRENLRIVTTRPSVISVGSSTMGTRTIADSNSDYPAETITFTERTSSTQYPILNLTSLDWLDEELGAAIYTPYATTLEAGNGSYGGYSLAKVEYTTRYLAVPVNCASPLTEEIEAQFLLLEDS